MEDPCLQTLHTASETNAYMANSTQWVASGTAVCCAQRNSSGLKKTQAAAHVTAVFM